MGTDIHVVAQVRNAAGEWVDIETAGYELENRSYTWFTFLDGCRERITNGDRKLGILPLSKPRGCPSDFAIRDDEDMWTCDSYHGDKWMGYGPSSWATFAEILENEKRQPPLEFRFHQLDELERLFAGRDPSDCRIVWGCDS